ncbi:MAG TPA: hypothetical protein VFR80_10685, partial [Pyrinomonadaceae bacterium]|nr:hypothetical protein [Pyrinomonadaceae bacterium]
MSDRRSQSLLMVLLLVFLPACSSGNETAQSNAPEAAQSIPSPSPKSAFERDLQFIRNGQFTYVWVFSRADGKPIDRDDANFLRKSAPQLIDLVITDEGKRVIGGTNFDLEQGPMPELRKRFVVEDFTG